MVALQQDDNAAVRSLWQCGLTLTLRVRHMSEIQKVLAVSIMHSESIRMQDRVLTDSFVAFAAKVSSIVRHSGLSGASLHAQIADDSLKHITYNGTKLNKSMMSVAQILDNSLNNEHKDVLDRISRCHGREAFHTAYNKLGAIVRACQKHATASHIELGECLSFVLEAILMTLDRKLVMSAKVFTIEAMDRQKDGSAGWLSITLTKMTVLRHMLSLTYDLNSVDKPAADQLIEKVFSKFRSPASLHKSFMVVESAGDVVDTGVSIVDDEFVENDDPLSEARVGLSKCGVKLLEFLHNMFEGGMDADFRALASQENPVAILLDPQVAEGGSAGRLAREVIRLMSSPGQVVLSTGDAPPVSLRSLARLKSDPDSDGAEVDRVREQRADVWGQAQQQRRKYVQVSVWQGKKKEGLASIFAKSRVSDFKGTAKESHRAFFFSADLAPEHPTEPWNFRIWTTPYTRQSSISSRCRRSPSTSCLFSMGAAVWRGARWKTCSINGLMSLSVGLSTTVCRRRDR